MMSNTPPPKPPTLIIGQKSTIGGTQAALKLFGRCQSEYYMPSIDEIQKGSVIDVKETIANFAGWMLIQKKPKSNDYYSAGSIIEYVGKVKEELKKLRPDNAIWNTDTWYTAYASEIKKSR